MRSDYSMTYDGDPEFAVSRAPSPGIAAVLSVFIPGLGQVYSGRLLAGGLWFLGTCFAYSAVLLPGFIVHAFCIWSAYKGAMYFSRYY
jgi:TM2 domain-containing membrane protein YozV